MVGKQGSKFEVKGEPSLIVGTLADLEKAYPGAIDRYYKIVEDDKRLIREGRRWAFAALFLLIGSSVFCAYMDWIPVALGILGMGTASIIATFVTGQKPF